MTEVQSPLLCPNPDCQEPLVKVLYNMYGAKVYDQASGTYRESPEWMDGDMRYTCPHCDQDLGEYATEEEMGRLL